MPISQMRNGLTAEKSIFSQKPSISVPRSKFDFGRLNCFTSDIGMIVPVDVFPTLPNEDIQLSCQYKIDWRPLIVPTLTSYKVKVHYYYCPNEYLWSGWETFISKGRSGNLILQVPKIKVSSLCSNTVKLSGLTDPNFKTADGTYFPYTPQSLLSYMLGSVPYSSTVNDNYVPDHYLPYGDSANTMTATGYKTVDTNALPFLMYQKIYRSNYLDPNLYDNGKANSPVWFPVDIDSSHWRINYGGTNIGGTYNEFFVPDTISSIPSSPVANFVPFPNSETNTQDGDTAVNLTQLRYSMYTDDMFTTALPFLQRGTPVGIDFDVPGGQIDIDVTGGEVSIPYTPAGSVSIIVPKPTISFSGTSQAPTNSPISGTRLTGSGSKITSGAYFDSSWNNATGSVSASINQGASSASFTGSSSTLVGNVSGISGTAQIQGASLSITAQKLRDLIAVSVWQERNALTNGSYGQFIKVHYDKYPDNSFFEPIYIGGTTSVFNVSAVLQQSATTTNSENQFSPLGNPAGVGGSSNQQSIGTFHSNDFGFIMVLMTIIPDTTYVQTTEHWQYDVNPDDYYMPEFERLSYQPITNKQLYVSGDSGTEDSVDDNLFGYSNRYVYLKQRDSVARGMLSLPANLDAYYHSYVQSRVFSSTPKLTQQFVTCYPPNIDRSMLASPGEPAFICQFYSGVQKVSPMSYVSQPNTFGF